MAALYVCGQYIINTGVKWQFIGPRIMYIIYTGDEKLQDKCQRGDMVVMMDIAALRLGFLVGSQNNV
jgi:hypothetical protein